MLNSLVPSPLPHPPLLPPRRRGGQPSNRNAFKHGLYAHKRPAPLTRFSNSLPCYTDVLFQNNPAVLGSLICNLNIQINRLVGLQQSFVDRGDTTSFCAWHKVFLRTVNISMYIKSICHSLQQPFQDLQFVAENALALIFYEFREQKINPAADSFLIELKKNDLNSIPSRAAIRPPISEPDFPFLTPRQWQVLEPLIPASSGRSGEAPSIGEAPGMGVRRSRGRPPADPHLILAAIFWKIAHHARWQGLPAGSPSMAVCRRYYRSLFRSGRLAIIYRRLHQDLCTRAHIDLTSLVKRGCFVIMGNKLALRPGLRETWRMRAALLFMQPAFQSFRRFHRREMLQERRRCSLPRLPRLPRLPSLKNLVKLGAGRRPTRQPLPPPPEPTQENFKFPLPFKDLPIPIPIPNHPQGP